MYCLLYSFRLWLMEFGLSLMLCLLRGRESAREGLEPSMHVEQQEGRCGAGAALSGHRPAGFTVLGTLQSPPIHLAFLQSSRQPRFYRNGNRASEVLLDWLPDKKQRGAQQNSWTWAVMSFLPGQGPSLLYTRVYVDGNLGAESQRSWLEGKGVGGDPAGRWGCSSRDPQGTNLLLFRVGLAPAAGGRYLTPGSSWPWVKTVSGSSEGPFWIRVLWENLSACLFCWEGSTPTVHLRSGQTHAMRV